MLQPMGSQTARHNLVTKQQQQHHSCECLCLSGLSPSCLPVTFPGDSLAPALQPSPLEVLHESVLLLLCFAFKDHCKGLSWVIVITTICITV